MVSFPRQAIAAARVYRRTPRRLRGLEPAARAGLTVATVWFVLLFFSLGVVALRSQSRIVGIGYLAGAVLGPIGLGLFLTRRPRVGLVVVGAMLVVGQGVAFASVMST
ncbi:MAG: hypothetical protein HYX32_10745 [Actinobacteria bacterium]|nr:hypothetical protein [Actinomycetota bacterium]